MQASTKYIVQISNKILNKKRVSRGLGGTNISEERRVMVRFKYKPYNKTPNEIRKLFN